MSSNHKNEQSWLIPIGYNTVSKSTNIYLADIGLFCRLDRVDAFLCSDSFHGLCEKATRAFLL